MEKLFEIAARLDEMQTNLSKLSWVQYTSGYDFGIEKAYKEINDFLEDKNNYELVSEYMKRDLDPVNRRRVEIFYNTIRSYHLSDELNELNEKIQKKTNELSMILNTFRFKLDGKEVSSVELTQILSNEDNRELRKKAYFARNQINQPLVEGGFIDLINMRKEYATLYGDKDFVEYSLKQNELSPTIFNNWENELKPYIDKLNSKRQEYARKFLNGDEMMPWDEDYIMAKIAPIQNRTVDMSNYYETLRKFFLNFGLDLDNFNITYDIFSRKNKSEWGYNFPIKDGVDSRILANVKNKYHEYKVLLHETGHGIHSFLLKPEEILLNQGVSGIIAEGIANLFGGFLYDEMFYRNFFDKSVELQLKELAEYNKLNYLRFIGSIFFDHELYRNEINSLQDIENLYFKVFEDLFGDKPFDDAPPFAYRIHYTTHPIYMHNYFMGDVTCEMIRKVFCKKYGVNSVTEKPKEFGDFLINKVIDPSGLYKYEELFARISGEGFSLKWYLE
ncbi:peptidase M3A and M3B thimet/oligopeptidase F [Tissierella sp. P1]|uniref:M3 family metallopeptidase n=1 Tax=Tissierella sp. P1 TaxID=1280483 RepID=UPI000BA0A2F2|nr:M3 family metallopeptidase [Tissierella sp. P1]OZV11538.1 peptidase M3A and M3B thimet/oligopeptidase F [Tissierella sp. P1]